MARALWATWWGESAPDDLRDSPDGPLRAATSLVVLRCACDLTGWLEAGAPEAEPDAGEVAVVVWRDRELDACRATPTDEELAAIEAALAGAPPPWAADEVVADLHAAGIFVGSLG